MTKQPSLHGNIGGAGRPLGPQSAALQLLPFKHPNSGKAEKIKPPMPAPAELFTSPKLDLIFLFLLNLIALVRGGADRGRGDLRVRGVQKGGCWGVECHKATAVQGCLSLQGSTPRLSW